MKLQAVFMDEISKPSARAPRKEVRKVLDEFWNSGNPIMRVDYEDDEYVSTSSAKSSFLGAINNSGYNITAMIKNGRLYLVRLSSMK